MNSIQQQGQDWLHTIATPETVKVYRDGFTKTGQILWHIGKLLWLNLCLLYVTIAWIVGNISNAITRYRSWQQQVAGKEQGNLATEHASALWTLTKTRAISLYGFAQQQLQLDRAEVGLPDTADVPVAPPQAIDFESMRAPGAAPIAN